MPERESTAIAIANQTPELVEQGNPTSLLVENSVLGVGVKAVDESESSAASVPNPEKWSYEAIVARSNVRPEHMQKLKLAGNSGQKPGFDFLQECWNDDPALVISCPLDCLLNPKNPTPPKLRFVSPPRLRGGD